MDVFFIGATWLDVMAISLVIGLLAYVLWIVPMRTVRTDKTIHDHLWFRLGGAIVIMTLASVVWLISRTLELSGATGLPALIHYLSLVIDKTQYGHIWQIRMGMMGLIAICWVAGALRSAWRPIAALLGLLAMLVVIFTRSATGHAADHGIFTAGVWVDWLHVLSGSAWAGCFFVAALWVSPGLAKADDGNHRLAALVYSRLSRVLEISLFIVALTGIYNAWRGGVHISHLGQTLYGQVLVVKIGLLGVMLWLGAHNRYVKLPALRHWVGRHHPMPGYCRFRIQWLNRGISGYLNHQVLVSFSRTILWESLISTGILLAAAILHHSMPPAALQHFG